LDSEEDTDADSDFLNDSDLRSLVEADSDSLKDSDSDLTMLSRLLSESDVEADRLSLCLILWNE
jgi:hypothetical protein